MNNTRILILLTILCVATTAITGVTNAQTTECKYPVSSIDATGTNITITQEPDRIVTLAPSAAQTLWEIGAKDKVVGVSQFADYLEGASKRANISVQERGTYNYELIRKLNPDLVLAPGIISNEAVQEIRSLNITVYKFRDAKDLQYIYEKTKLMGRFVQECKNAQTTVQEMKKEVRIVRNTVEDEQRPTSLFLLNIEPPRYTAGKNTPQNQLINIAGGRNIAAENNITSYKPISNEVVLNSTVEWLILPDRVSHPPRTPTYNSTRAVQTGQILYVNNDLINQPAPRIVQVLGKVAKTFHPGKYTLETIKANNPNTTNQNSRGQVPQQPLNESIRRQSLNQTQQNQTNTTTEESSTKLRTSEDDISNQDTPESTQNNETGRTEPQEQETGGSGILPLLLATAASIFVFGVALYRYIRPYL